MHGTMNLKDRLNWQYLGNISFIDTTKLEDASISID
jgi:hypothetical protein